MSDPDPALVLLRSDYRRLNAAFGTSFAFRFGRGAGFCAEMLGLIKSMMSCLHGSTRLCLSRGGPPKGVGIVDGFTDYFDPLFPEVDAGILNRLNRGSVRGSGRLPITRKAVSRLLRAATGVERFMMDDIVALPSRLVVQELRMNAEYWDACALLARVVWVYRPEVESDITASLSAWKIPTPYVAVHLRRGDKSRESPYTPAGAYSEAIQRVRPDGGTVVIASDDGNAVRELTDLLPARYRVIPCSEASDRGYRQEEFNRLPASERFQRLKRFLAELEVLRGGDLFIGSASSNVTYLIEMMRAGHGVLQVR